MKLGLTLSKSIVVGASLALAPLTKGTPPVGGLLIGLLTVAIAGNIAGLWLRRRGRWARLDQKKLARILGGLCIGIAIGTLAAVVFVEFDVFALILALAAGLTGGGVTAWGWTTS